MNQTERYKSEHVRTSVVTAAEKVKRLRTWKNWRRFGLRGLALIKKTKMRNDLVRRWAAEVGFDLEGLADG